MYNILEARLEYKNKKLNRVTVLVEISPRDIRAIYLTDTYTPGYGDPIGPNEPITDGLLQRVAGWGIQRYDTDKVFRGWKRKHYPNWAREERKKRLESKQSYGKLNS